ncbi:LytTR family DNA-binding domain-containing protein [Longibaculum muris]|uniref:LytTR family transcriptional regulator n=1 Tax=Longibaculum muris TaxID=1796628 RepID=A0A4R3Z839_9FIRM|nr:LytTR family DNA-binding domain-containing protein [Longibaculum muris]MBS5368089.1 LytTR family transcriptional regulator [Coprobacillus cateniformis]MCR1887501.1 LytTR family transcriptional regulator [Longibaculum muris]MED9811781.1 LytTR family DNA-binding domain-containing protein [Longibaculum muris]TCW00782.1 LytTR family transcriptional regulator [Longibaculum muris]
MKVKVELDQDCVEPIILIKTKEITNEINELIQFLNSKQYEMIAGFYNDTVELLEQSQIIRFYASQQKVYAQVNDREYVIRLRLYEIENRLNQKDFIRISHSEIVNLKAIEKLDLSFSGTIQLLLSNGEVTYVSRRYVKKIKEILGI